MKLTSLFIVVVIALAVTVNTTKIVKNQEKNFLGKKKQCDFDIANGHKRLPINGWGSVCTLAKDNGEFAFKVPLNWGGEYNALRGKVFHVDCLKNSPLTGDFGGDWIKIGKIVDVDNASKEDKMIVGQIGAARAGHSSSSINGIPMLR